MGEDLSCCEGKRSSHLVLFISSCVRDAAVGRSPLGSASAVRQLERCAWGVSSLHKPEGLAAELQGMFLGPLFACICLGLPSREYGNTATASALCKCILDSSVFIVGPSIVHVRLAPTFVRELGRRVPPLRCDVQAKSACIGTLSSIRERHDTNFSM